MTCPDCPCPDICRRLPAYCRWAAEDPPDPIRIAHICDASRRNPGPASSPAPSLPPSGDAARPDIHATLALMAAIKACPFRSQTPGCGCGGSGHCALKIDPIGPTDRPRRGGVSSPQECMECIRRFG